MLSGTKNSFAACILITLFTGIHTNETTTGITSYNNVDRGYRAVSFSSLHNCSLSVQNKSILENFDDAINKGYTMFKIDIRLRGRRTVPETISGKLQNEMFKPLVWIKATRKIATKVLLLRPNYDILSFHTLTINRKTFESVAILETPQECLNGLSYNEVEYLLRDIVMNNLKVSPRKEETEPTEDTVCNQHIRDIQGAKILYLCCHRDKTGNTTCDYLMPDSWFNFMSILVLILNMSAVLFSPLLIPGRFYYRDILDEPFYYKPEDHQVKQHVLVELKKEGEIIAKDTFKVKLSKLKRMTKFKEIIKELYKTPPKLFEVQEAELFVEDELIASDDAPVGIFTFLYDVVEQIWSLNNINDKRMGPRSVYRCARTLLKVFIVLVLILLIAVRDLVFFTTEQDEMELRREAANERGLSLNFPGNLILHLTPLHPVLIAAFALFSLGFIVVGNKSSVTITIHALLRSYFRDNMAENKSKVLLIIRKWCLTPCKIWKKHRILAVLIFVFALPLSIMHISFYILPSLNILVRLIAQLVAYIIGYSDNRETSRIVIPKNGAGFIVSECGKLKFSFRAFFKDIFRITNKKALSTKNSLFWQIIVLVFCFFSFMSGLIIVFEISNLLLDVFIYTFLGIAMYANYTWRYISLAVVVIVYAKSCFSAVPERYKMFSKTLNSFLLKHSKDKISPVIFQTRTEQKNTAFALNPCNIFKNDDILSCPCVPNAPNPVKWEETIQLESRRGRLLTWSVQRVVFFVDKDDITYLPAKFFFAASKMNHSKSLGGLHERYLRAFVNFAGSILFLVIVLFVVLTFVEWDEISATNQVLATLAGGITPLLMRNFILKSNENTVIDPNEDIGFRASLHKLLESYEEEWLVYDLEAEECSCNLQQDTVPRITIVYEREDINEYDFLGLQRKLLPEQA